MHLKLTTLILVLLSWMLAGPGRAGETRDPAKNAALHYWRALVHVPQDSRGTQWEVPAKSPLTCTLADARFLLSESGISFPTQWAISALRRGSRMPYCEWGLPLRDGPLKLTLHHVQRAREPIGLLLLSSRLNRADGHVNEAIDDLGAAWVFTRHLATDGTLMTWIIHHLHIDRTVGPLTCGWVPSLDEHAVAELRDQLHQLPVVPTFEEIFRQDRRRFLQHFRETLEKSGIAEFRTQCLELANTDEDRTAIQALDAAEQGLAWVEEAEILLNVAGEISRGPLSEFESEAEELQRRVEVSSPLTRMVLGKSWDQPSVLRHRLKEEMLKARLSMLEAAIALRLGGVEAFEKVQDPFGAGPFEHEETDGGYTLTSELLINGKPFVIAFGEAALPEPDADDQLLIYDEDADAASDVKQALASARREGKRVLLQWGFNGCIPCYRLHRKLDEDPDLSRMLRSGFVRQSIDVTNDSSDALIEKYDVELPGVPHLTVLKADGSVLVNLKPSKNFYVDDSLSTDRIRSFLQRWAPNAPNEQ